MTWAVMRLLRTRWGMFLCALVALALGGAVLSLSGPTHFTRIDGMVASYTVVRNAGGSYDHNELRLVGDAQTYTLDDGSYSPTPPDVIQAGARVSIWVEQGHPWILAISIVDAGGSARRYATFAFAHPDQNLLYAHIFGWGFVGIGVLLALMGLAWKRLPWRQRRKPSYTPTYLAPGMYDEDQGRR